MVNDSLALLIYIAIAVLKFAWQQPQKGSDRYVYPMDSIHPYVSPSIRLSTILSICLSNPSSILPSVQSAREVGWTSLWACKQLNVERQMDKHTDSWKDRCTAFPNAGLFLKRFHLAFLDSSWFPRREKILLWKAKTKGYLWVCFHDIRSLLKSSKLDL